MVALRHVANKMLQVTFSVLKNERPYAPILTCIGINVAKIIGVVFALLQLSGGIPLIGRRFGS